MTIGIEEILATGRPSLRDRAKQAHEQRTQFERDSLEETRDALIADILDWLNNELGVDHGTRVGIKFNSAGTEKGLPAVTFKCEGITFRGRYDTRKVRIDTSNDFEEISLAMQVSRSETVQASTAWLKVENLADIGKVLS